MSTSALVRLPKSGIELTMTVPWAKAQTEYEKTVDELVKTAEVDGFRKGKAPREVVEKKLDKNKIYQIVLENLLQTVYPESVKQQEIKPITEPRITIEKLEEGKDWIFRAVTCERPEIELGDYKKEIAGAKAQANLWVPGKDPKEAKKEIDFGQIVKAFLQTVKIELPDILVENEVNRQLAQLLDEVKKLGLTLEQYLVSSGKTVESLRQEYAQKASAEMTMEFALEEVANKEKISVEEADIEKFLKEITDPKTKEALEKNRYLAASLIRRQKTLDFLRGS